MTKAFTQTALALTALHISAQNMRSENKEVVVEDIIDSIRENGIMVPLIVRREDKANQESGEKQEAYGVVAGRRRFTALWLIHQKEINEFGDNAKAPLIPCIVIDKDDDALAYEVSLTENVSREQPSPMEEYKCFANLLKAGTPPHEIGKRFGISEKGVRQRLALGQLVAPLQKLYDAKEINIDTVKALTLGNKSQQRAWLKLYKENNAPMGRWVKDWLSGGDAVKTSAAIFPLEDYKGKLLADLFGEEEQFACTETFWKHQNAAIAERERQYKEDGWQDVIIHEGHFYQYDFEETSKEEGGRVYIIINKNGTVKFIEGLLTYAEANRKRRAKAKAKNGETSQNHVPTRPEMSGPLVEYFDAHRALIAKVGLMSRPDMAQRLMVASMIAGSQKVSVSDNTPTIGKEETAESLKSSKASRLLSEERNALCDLLGLKGERKLLCLSYNDKTSFMSLFAKLLKLSDEEVNRIQTFIMCERLCHGNAVVEAVGALSGVKPEDYWSPDDAFFNILRDKNIIKEMVAEVGGRDLANQHQHETGKAQKARLVELVEQKTEWRPKWLYFQPSAYRKIEGCELARRWKSIKKHFKSFTM